MVVLTREELVDQQVEGGRGERARLPAATLEHLGDVNSYTLLAQILLPSSLRGGGGGGWPM